MDFVGITRWLICLRCCQMRLFMQSVLQPLPKLKTPQHTQNIFSKSMILLPSECDWTLIVKGFRLGIRLRNLSRERLPQLFQRIAGTSPVAATWPLTSVPTENMKWIFMDLVPVLMQLQCCWDYSIKLLFPDYPPLKSNLITLCNYFANLLSAFSKCKLCKFPVLPLSSEHKLHIWLNKLM